MNENYIPQIPTGLVRRRHDELVAAGHNPWLADVQTELLKLDCLRLTETEIAEHLIGEPLTAGRRGRTQKSVQAASASRRAASASRDAELDDTPQAHFDAHLAHFAAACAARSLADYHEAQKTYHADKANLSQPADVADSADTGADETPAAAKEPQPAEPIDCARAACSLLSDGEGLPQYLHYMPAGLHLITPSQSGRPVTVLVEVNQQSAELLEQQRELLAASGNRPFFSVQHSTQIAAFWPTRFVWDTRLDATGKLVEGVWADGDWSLAGREAVEGKNFRSFSPTFFVDRVTTDPARPAQVVCYANAKLNMGALENDPAFAAISPLWKNVQPQPQLQLQP